MSALSVILFGVDVYILNQPMDMSGNSKPIKLMQTDIPQKDKSKTRRLYEKGGRDFRLYYESRWYKSQANSTYNQRYMAKLGAKDKAYKILREEDYKKYGCEDNPKWEKWLYSIDYYRPPANESFASRVNMSRAGPHEQCEIYIVSQNKNKNKKKNSMNLF